jgi:hypothetical protein
MSAPFTYLLVESKPQWIAMTPTCSDTFETFKLRLISAPCMVLPEVSSDATYTVATYSSSLGIAVVTESLILP